MRTGLIIILVIVTRTASELCKYEDSVELTNGLFHGIKYNEGEYFVDNTTGVKRGCVCKKETCARKCCPFGQGYDLKLKTCVDLPDKFDPPVYKGSKIKQDFDITKEFYFLFFKMNCSDTEFRTTVKSATPDYHLKTDGKLYVTMENNIPSHLIYGPDKYCVDNFIAYNDETDEKTVQYDSIICFVPQEDYNNYALNACCMLVSCFFIILTVSVYAFLQELRTLHGMIMIACLMSFFIGFLFMATMQLLLLYGYLSQVYCTGMTFVIYFAILAAFFWLNVMSFDLWAKLRSINVVRGFTRSRLHRFLYYCAYAFGLPAVLTIILAALEFSNLSPDIKLLPHLRRQGCFIHGKSKLLYLYTPIIFVCAANLVLFIMTAVKIAEVKKQTQMLQRKDTQRFSLYIKLFFVTGISWILEVISSLYPEIELWQFTDAYNVLFGLIIFIIFVCKKKIFLLIRKRYKQLMGLTLPVASTATSSGTVSLSKEENIQMKCVDTDAAAEHCKD